MSSSLPPPQVRIRPATSADVNFIFNSWLKCYRHSQATLGCDNIIYFAHHHKVLEGLCKTANVLVACNDQDVGQIYGYVVAEKQEDVLVVHFTYVKAPFRKMGIGMALLGAVGWQIEDPLFYTHKTFASSALEQKHKLIYNPYLAYYAYGKASK